MGFETVDQYVAALPEPAREAMERLRDLAGLRRVRDPAGNLIRINELTA